MDCSFVAYLNLDRKDLAVDDINEVRSRANAAPVFIILQQVL